MIVVLIMVGGGLGAVARWGATLWIGQSARGFPMGTTVVNVVGSFALGFIVGAEMSLGSFDPQPLTVGLLGGFTTFSTWMVQIADEEDRKRSDFIVLVPTLVGVAVAAVGIGLGRAFNG